METKYVTEDGVEVTAVKRDEPDEKGHFIWDIEFPDGEIREADDSVFSSLFKEE